MLVTKRCNRRSAGTTAGSGSGAPTAFQAWEKSCSLFYLSKF